MRKRLEKLQLQTQKLEKKLHLEKFKLEKLSIENLKLKDWKESLHKKSLEISQEAAASTINPIRKLDAKTYLKEAFIYDLKAGFITAIVALPLAIAFAIASGVHPIMGLYTAIIAEDHDFLLQGLLER